MPNRSRFVVGGLLMLLLSGGVGRAEDAPGTTRKTEDRLNFQLPPDWPVEKRNGIMAPIPVEEYLAKKFKALDSRLEYIEQRFNAFDIRLRALEEQNKKQSQTLKSTGGQ